MKTLMKVKIAFLIILLVAAAGVYFHENQDAIIKQFDKAVHEPVYVKSIFGCIAVKDDAETFEKHQWFREKVFGYKLVECKD